MSDFSELKKLAEAATGFSDVSLAPDVLLELIADYERVTNNRDMWKGQCERQSEMLRLTHEADKLLKAECEGLRKIISDSAAACGAAVSVECSLEFMAMLPSEIGSVVGGLRKDARRYRFLRNQHWPVAYLAVVVNPKASVKLGHDCPSGDRLDEQVDGVMKREASHD